jgi:hypothetical protein
VKVLRIKLYCILMNKTNVSYTMFQTLVTEQIKLDCVTSDAMYPVHVMIKPAVCVMRLLFKLSHSVHKF